MSMSGVARTPALPGAHAADYDIDADGRPDLVWYASYGSNLCATRFTCYLAGGTPPGSRRTYLGCVNRSPARQDLPVILPGELHFACTSTVWGGGIAFLDTSRAGPALGRAWLISADQFEQVVAQENGEQASDGSSLPWTELLAAGTVDIGTGLYGTLCHIGDLEGAPVLTMTAPFSLVDALRADGTLRGVSGAQPVSTNRPTPAYLGMLARGLEETFALTPDEVHAYLAAAAGADSYSGPALRAALAAAS